MEETFEINIDRTKESEKFKQRIDYLDNKTMKFMEAENFTRGEAMVIFGMFLRRIVELGRP